MRTRAVEQAPLFGGQACPPLTEIDFATPPDECQLEPEPTTTTPASTAAPTTDSAGSETPDASTAASTPDASTAASTQDALTSDAPPSTPAPPSLEGESSLCFASGVSYVLAQIELSALATEVRLSFRTRDPEGILLVILPPEGGTGFVAVTVRNRRVAFGLDLGQPMPLMVSGGQNVDDGQWHQVVARRLARASEEQTVESLLLTVDGVQSSTSAVSVR